MHNMMDIENILVQWFIAFLIEGLQVVQIVTTIDTSAIMQNQQLAYKLNKLVTRYFEK